MHVDETRRNDETVGVDRHIACQRTTGDAGNRAAPDPDIADSVQTGFGIDDAPAFDHDVIRRVWLRMRAGGNEAADGRRRKG